MDWKALIPYIPYILGACVFVLSLLFGKISGSGSTRDGTCDGANCIGGSGSDGGGGGE